MASGVSRAGSSTQRRIATSGIGQRSRGFLSARATEANTRDTVAATFGGLRAHRRAAVRARRGASHSGPLPKCALTCGAARLTTLSPRADTEGVATHPACAANDWYCVSSEQCMHGCAHQPFNPVWLKGVQLAQFAPGRRLPSKTVVAPHEITLELRQCSESGRRKGSERLGGRAPVLTTSFGDVLCASLSCHLRASWGLGRRIQQHRLGLPKDFANPPDA